jgi:MoaA/NifB/PqqE/SkfB family radical SAM enzyme
MIPKRNLVRIFKKAISQPGYAFHAFKQRLFSFLSYKLGNGYSAYPESIALFLTYRCNLRCLMCSQWGECGTAKNQSPEFLKKELSIKQVRGIIDDICAFKPNITLFGGEPLLYEDYLEVIKYVKAKNLRCNIVTNGTLLELKVDEMVELGMDEIIFSLEGPAWIHDKITQVEGSYARALSGFKVLSSIKKERASKKPQLNICCTISPENYRYLNDVVDSSLEIEANSITFHHLAFISREVYKQHNLIFKDFFGIVSPDWEGFIRDTLPNIDIEYLIKEMGLIKDRQKDLNIFFYPNYTPDEIRRYYSDFDFSANSYPLRCLSPWMQAYIFPDGSVRSCEELNLACGNIKESSFIQIWNNRKYRNFRRIVKKQKFFPVCSRCTEFYRF